MFWRKKMKKIELKGLNEYIYEDICDNGLKVYVWVQKKANAFKGSLTFLCGAEDISFQNKGKNISVPLGTAHYLEHIMCKDEKNVSLLSRFQALNAYSNASTFPDRTVYEFVGSDNLEEDINLLLDSIQSKKFSQKALASERGPIIEEARIQSDNVNRLSLYGVNQTLFKTYHNHYCGTGRKEDIEKITLDDLKIFYETFYHPLNSFLVITGNVDPEKVFEIVKENQKKKTFKKYHNPLKETYEEPCDIVLKNKDVLCNVEVPKTYVSLKIPLKKEMSSFTKMLTVNAFELLFAANYGSTSLFQENFLNDNLGLTLNTQAYIERDYIVCQIIFRSYHPKEALERVLEKLKHMQYDEENIKRKVKSAVASLVLNYEDVEDVNDFIVYELSNYHEIITNEKEMLENLTVHNVQKITENIFNYPYSVFTLVPKKKPC